MWGDVDEANRTHSISASDVDGNQPEKLDTFKTYLNEPSGLQRGKSRRESRA